ncbi:MAG: Icc-related predicted phosphoesterase [Planctomycetota bacterium]|jgi:Icc-related predicted phosphoesterase
MPSLRIVSLSDTHTLHDRIDVPDGDVLVHAGDFTNRGSEDDVASFGAFLAGQPHRHKVIVAGNHDFLFESDRERAEKLLGDVVYLQDSGATIEGVEFWGSPWQPWFKNWAFNLERGAALAAKWELIPGATDVLITHGPAYGVLDQVLSGEPVGCEELRKTLDRVQPSLHVFGHIHEARGSAQTGPTLSVNASNCNVAYHPRHAAVVIDFDLETREPKIVQP